ncbi:MAG: response regulator [Desulfobacteraceae bacterium]|nr:response regulator [Desulfobacteraceae bacterium]
MKTILIVDDETKIRNLYKRLLEKEGFSVVAAKNAELAHELLLHHPVDLTLLDINLEAHVDGSTLYDVMAAFFQKTRVLVASVYPVEEQKKRIEGAAGYYDKAEGIHGLIEQVKRVLEDAPEPAAALNQVCAKQWRARS